MMSNVQTGVCRVCLRNAPLIDRIFAADHTEDSSPRRCKGSGLEILDVDEVANLCVAVELVKQLRGG